MSTTTARIAMLPDRGVLSVTGEDAAKLLQGVVTNDMAAFEAGAHAIHAGLLTPQGKILHEFLIARKSGGGGFLIETARERTADLAKRLGLYRLRAKAEIRDVSSDYTVAVRWDTAVATAAVADGWRPPAADTDCGAAVECFADPRHPGLGVRLVLSIATDWVLGRTGAVAASADDYHAHRVALGVPEGGRDYALGDTFPHEADFDLYRGVSFTKGCFVGQEVVARMQHKSVVRKRVVPVAGHGLAPGAEVRFGEVVIGTVGTVAGDKGLALLRLDRAAEALDGGTPLTAGGVPVEVDAGAMARYRASVAEKAAAP